MKIKSPILLIGGSSSLGMTRNMSALARRLVALRGERPRFAVLPTASGDDQDIINEITGYFDGLDCDFEFITLCRGDTRGLEARLRAADVIYVPGGIEKRLTEYWAAYGVDRVARSLTEEGNPLLAGSSAGAMAFSFACPFVTPDGESVIFKGYGFVRVWFTPHYQLAEYKGFDAGLAEQRDPPLAFACGDDSAVLCTPDGAFVPVTGDENNGVLRYDLAGGEWAVTKLA